MSGNRDRALGAWFILVTGWPGSGKSTLAAALAILRVARRCPGAVLDSTWLGYALPPAGNEPPGSAVQL